MQALLFAAGIGSRLRPFTDSHPKALAPVAGVPILQLQLLRLKALGVTRVVINVHQHAQQILDFLEEHADFGLQIAVSDERQQLLDTGGGLLYALQQGLIKPLEPLLLHNVDILTTAHLRGIFRAYGQAQCDAMLMCSDRPTSRHLYFDTAMQLRGWRNDKTGQLLPSSFIPDRMQPLAFDGIHIVNPKTLLPQLRAYSQAIGSDIFSLTPFYLASLAALDIRGFRRDPSTAWFDIGTPQRLASASAFVEANRAKFTL